MAVVQDARVSQSSHDFQGEIDVNRNQSNFNHTIKKNFEFLRFYSFFTIFEEIYIDLTRQKLNLNAKKMLLMLT